MGAKFTSQKLPDDVVVTSPHAITKSTGLKPLIDANASILATEFQDPQPLINNQQEKNYMDDMFGGGTNDKAQGQQLPLNHGSNTSQADLSMSEDPFNTSLIAPNKVSSAGRLLDYSKRHIEKVVCEQLFLNELSADKWEKMLTEFVMKAVEQVKPSSRMFGDSMDINECIKVKIIDWKDNSKSAYINGIVMSKSIASKRMQTTRVNPRILLLRALDQDAGRNSNFIIPDLKTKIDVEGHNDQILEQKLEKINPNLVIIQRDISVKLMNMMREKKITVVCNLEDRKIKRLARLTRTIVLPSINVIDSSFCLGHCKLFREDNLSRQLRGQDAYFTNTHTVEQTLLVFDGCDPDLGCTICLSGPISKEGEELIKVKQALKQMLVLAKNIVLERHFLTQIQCMVPELPLDHLDQTTDQNTHQSESQMQRQSRQQSKHSRQRQGQNKGGANSALEEVLNKWEMTDLYSPFLITNAVSNRTRMVYKKIMIALKQRDEAIPSGPTAYEREDIPSDLNDTMSNFIRENTEHPSNRDTFSTTAENVNKPFVMSDGRLKINEKYVQTKLDKMCGMPKDAILFFSRQDIEKNHDQQKNDQTLGKYLEELAETARVKCDKCNLEKFQHSQEIYHRDGQIQITIKPQLQNHVATEQQTYNLVGRGKQPQSMMINTASTALQDVSSIQSTAQGGNHQAYKKKIQIYASCKTCACYCARSLVSSQLYEYSKARFFEQFFYNDKLKVKKGIFPGCDHGSHPLRDYIIEFAVDQCKIQFRYTQIDTYSIQIVNPKQFRSRESLRQLVQERKDRLQDVLEKALENFKLDQVGILKKEITATIQKYDMENVAKFRGTNMSVFVNHFMTVMGTLESMQNDFHVFQEEASKELAKMHDQLLHLMFLKRKILMTFLGYQRAIDETIQQLALLIVCARRRAQVIEFQLSQAGPETQQPQKQSHANPLHMSQQVAMNNYRQARNQQMSMCSGTSQQYGIIVDDESQSIAVQSNTATTITTNRDTAAFGFNHQSTSGVQSSLPIDLGSEESLEVVVSKQLSKMKTQSLKKTSAIMNLSSCAADIVLEEEEKESDGASLNQQVLKNGGESGDDMASVAFDQQEFTESDGSQSETEIRQIEGSFIDNKSQQSTKLRRGFSTSGTSSKGGLRSRALIGVSRKSFVSDVEKVKNKERFNRSIDEKVMSETGGMPRKFSNMKVKKQFGTGNSNANGSMASVSNQNHEPLAQGKRRMHVTSCQEDSMEDDEDEIQLPSEFKRHCFIEELCTCEITDSFSQHSNETKLSETSTHHHTFGHQQSQQISYNRKMSNSESFKAGELKSATLMKQNTMDPRVLDDIFETQESEQNQYDDQSSKITIVEKEFVPVIAQSQREPIDNITTEINTQQTGRFKSVATSGVLQNSAAHGSNGGHQMQASIVSQSRAGGNGQRQMRRPVTFCQMSGQQSLNKYCSVVKHIIPCYQKIMDEVTEMRNLLEKAIYLPSEENKAFTGLMSWYQNSAESDKQHKVIVLDESSPIVSPKGNGDVKFGQQIDSDSQFFNVGVRNTSQIDGFDTIAVEKRIQFETSVDGIDQSMDTNPYKKYNNRQGGDLKDDFDFIKVPKQEKARGDSPSPMSAHKVTPKNLSMQNPYNNNVREAKRVIDPPLQDKWLNIKWIKCLSKKSYPTLPFGVDNIFLNVDPNDLGSIIAYALTSNIYLEQMAVLKYMGLQDVLLKQQKKNNHTNYELLDKDDVLNDKHITHVQMEAEMLERNKISFAIKFSTHSKDVSISVQDGREIRFQNHAERHYRTGYTDKRMASKKLTQKDMQSVISQSDLRTIKGSIKTDHLNKPSNRSKGQKPDMKTKKNFNDFHLKVLPKYPKEYLKQQNITDVINDLEEVQSDLCRSYFSQDQITAINHFVNKKQLTTGPNMSTRNVTKLENQTQMYEQNSIMTGNQNNNGAIDSQSNMSMAFGPNGAIADESMQFTGIEQDSYFQQTVAQNNAVETSMDLSNADFAAFANQTNGSAFNASAGGFERTQIKTKNKKEMKKFVKDQVTKLNEKEENPMNLTEGIIFGTKSPAQQFIAEQTNSTKFINEELKIPKIDFEVRIFFPKRFSGMRRFYIGSHLDYIMSICKTKKWNSSGGKASMGFFTSHDKKYVFKSVKKEEFEMFCQFAPTFFDYMAKSFFHDYPCCLAKILGAYEIIIQCDTNIDYNSRVYILVSENLNLGIKKEDEPNIIRFDLKGSENNRLVTPPMGPDGRPERVVLLDNNFLYKMRARPVVLPFDDAQKLHICISNDIDQLQKMNIVDYSLLAVIDTRRKKIRFAIIDYCQFFNSKKQMEYMVKATVNLGSLPTIVPAELYRRRFMEFMIRHFVGVSRQDTKRRNAAKEHGKRSIMGQDAENDNKRQMEEIQEVIREVNQEHDDDGSQLVNRSSNRKAGQVNGTGVQLPKDVTIEVEDVSEAMHSPVMH